MKKMGLVSSKARQKELETKILEGDLTLYELRLLSLTLNIVSQYEIVPHDNSKPAVVIP